MEYIINPLIAIAVLGVLGVIAGVVFYFIGNDEEKDEKGSEAPALQEDEGEKLCAFIKCAGKEALKKYTYVGEADCFLASRLCGGAKECEFSCLGLGSCAEVCREGAISVEDGVCEVDSSKCTGCGECVKVCPRGVIELVPAACEVKVSCSNRALGSQTRKICEVGCIGCLACVKTCKYEAIEVNESLASIDYSKCTGCGECAEVCPRGIITAPAKEEPEEAFDEAEYFQIQLEDEEKEFSSDEAEVKE